MLPVPAVDKHPGVKKILALMGPAIFGVSVSQINLLWIQCWRHSCPPARLLALYSDRRELPGVFAVAIATVILPNLSATMLPFCEAYSRLWTGR